MFSKIAIIILLSLSFLRYWSSHSKSISKASDIIVRSPPPSSRKKGVSECLDYKNNVSFQLHQHALSFDDIPNSHSHTTDITEPHSHATNITELHSHTTESHIDQQHHDTPTNSSTKDTPTNTTTETTPTNQFIEQQHSYDTQNNFFTFPQTAINSTPSLSPPTSGHTPSPSDHTPSPSDHTPPRRFSIVRRSTEHFLLSKHKMSDLLIPEGDHFQKRYEGYWAYIIAVVLFYAIPTYQLLLTYQKV